MSRSTAQSLSSSVHNVHPASTCYSTMSRPNSTFPSKPASPDTVSQICENVIVDKEQLASICAHICNQLRTIINLVTDFAGDVCDESESAGSLLRELQDKVLPFLVNLDIEMAASEKLIRTNIDTARISETKVEWLLKFNKYKLEMREMLVTLSGAVFDDLERVLSLRYRGCAGLHPKTESLASLRHMKNDIERLQKQIKLEQLSSTSL